MKSKRLLRKNSWVHLISTVFIVGLTACDSGTEKAATSSSSTSSTRIMPTGATTGILVDSPVSGVSYAASSGKSGVTDDKGIFNFNHG
ncbi:MAG: adhesin, partial [Pseudomonadota bacterium]